jgi:DNA-binding NarL/FixJ family response regulator
MNTQSPIKVLLVDDHALIRDMLANQFSNEPDLHLAGVVESPCDIEGEAVSLRPDVIVLDIDAHTERCFDIARLVHESLPATRFVFLGAEMHDDLVEKAILSHASACVFKQAPLLTLLDAIRRAHRGLMTFPLEIHNRIVIDSKGMCLLAADSPDSRPEIRED